MKSSLLLGNLVLLHSDGIIVAVHEAHANGLVLVEFPEGGTLACERHHLRRLPSRSAGTQLTAPLRKGAAGAFFDALTTIKPSSPFHITPEAIEAARGDDSIDLSKVLPTFTAANPTLSASIAETFFRASCCNAHDAATFAAIVAMLAPVAAEGLAALLHAATHRAGEPADRRPLRRLGRIVVDDTGIGYRDHAEEVHLPNGAAARLWRGDGGKAARVAVDAPQGALLQFTAPEMAEAA